LYKGIQPPRALEIARRFSQITGYAVSDVPYEAAYAGYKDWFVEQYRKPGYTFEVGLGRNPISITQFNTIYMENEEVLLVAPII
jgi:g-D-glutamyl-meso-diaminopimelate peptidase